ncbi:MAG: type II toxin-antitoxin system death-on-curing family toxin [Chitinophagales bacterium]
MRYLSKDIIIHINKRMIDSFGGNFIPPNNILKNDNLEYLVEVIDSEMFGKPIYPEIHQKAAIYFYNIINGHIFNDGNKRTALESSILFLELNGFTLKAKLNNELISSTEIIDFSNIELDKLFQFTNYFASGLGDLELCTQWFKENIESELS